MVCVGLLCAVLKNVDLLCLRELKEFTNRK